MSRPGALEFLERRVSAEPGLQEIDDTMAEGVGLEHAAVEEHRSRPQDGRAARDPPRRRSGPRVRHRSGRSPARAGGSARGACSRRVPSRSRGRTPAGPPTCAAQADRSTAGQREVAVDQDRHHLVARERGRERLGEQGGPARGHRDGHFCERLRRRAASPSLPAWHGRGRGTARCRSPDRPPRSLSFSM